MCSASLYQSRSSTRLLLPKMEECNISKEDTGESGSEGNESETVELRAAFVIENSANHYICALSKYQRQKVARRAAQLSSVELTMPFRWSGVSWERALLSLKLHVALEYSHYTHLVIESSE